MHPGKTSLDTDTVCAAQNTRLAAYMGEEQAEGQTRGKGCSGASRAALRGEARVAGAPVRKGQGRGPARSTTGSPSQEGPSAPAGFGRVRWALRFAFLLLQLRQGQFSAGPCPDPLQLLAMGLQHQLC